jgi:hypothetical protein
LIKLHAAIVDESTGVCSHLTDLAIIARDSAQLGTQGMLNVDQLIGLSGQESLRVRRSHESASCPGRADHAPGHVSPTR